MRPNATVSAVVTIVLALAGAAVVLAAATALRRESPRRPVLFFSPALLVFVASAPAVYRAAEDSSGDSALMVGALVGAAVGVWRGRELATVGVRWRTGEIVAGGDRLGALALAGALVLDGFVAASVGGTSPGPILGLVGAAAGQLVGWHVGVYGRFRAERRLLAP